MTESEWLGSGDPAPLLRYLRERHTSERKLRLLACACCRRIWDRLSDPRSRDAVEVAERFADDHATRLELARARTRAVEVCDRRHPPPWAAYWAASVKASGPIWNVFAASSAVVPQPSKYSEADYSAELAGDSRRQVGLVHEVFGNPFRPGRLDAHVLAWGDGVVRRLAQAIYEDRTFQYVPVLGDALEDAGCSCDAILAHCHEHADEHVRGCWVLDLILGLA